MQPVNIFLGLGIVLILAALLGQIEALSVKIAPLATMRRRVVVGSIGLALVGAAYVLPLPGDSERRNREDVAAYQQQVLATCDRLQQILASGDDALTPEFSDGGEILFNRDQVLGLFNRQNAERDAALQELWNRDVPEALTDERDAAKALADEGQAFAPVAIAFIEQLPEQVRQTDLDELAQRVDTEHPGWRSRINAAFAALAGQTCNPS